MADERYFATIVYRREINNTKYNTLSHIAEKYEGQEHIENRKRGIAAFSFKERSKAVEFGEESKESLEEITHIRIGSL